MSVNQTRYIKNTSGSVTYYLGVPIEDGAFYQIPAEKYATYSNLDALITDISNGDAGISYDGETVISGVSNQLNALKGFATPIDSDGVALARTKMTQSGWHYQMYGFEFQTATLNSVVNNDVDGSNLGHVSIKFYNNSDVELTAGTQLELDLDCVKTVIDFEPPWDYEIIGGQFRQLALPGSDLRMHVVAVPDLTLEQGGSVPFVNNVNLKFVGTEDMIQTDGRTSKKLTYDAVYHTNKIRFIFEHGLLLNHKIHLMIELFRA